MKIATKIFMLTMLILIILMVSGNFFIGKFFREYLLVEERNHIQTSVQSVASHIREKEQSYLGSVNDWSKWDEPYNFMNAVNPEFVKENVVDSTFHNLDINALMMIDKNKVAVEKLYYSFDKNGYEEFPESLLDEVRKSLPPGSTDQQGTQIIYADGRYYIMAFSQIADTGNTKPANGTMIFARVIDKAFIAHMEEEADATITLSNKKDVGSNVMTRFYEVPITNGLAYASEINDKGDKTFNYAEIQKKSDTEASIVAVIIKKRGFYLDGMAQYGRLRLEYSLFILFMGILIYVLLNTYVSRPLKKISKSLLSIDLDKEHFAPLRVKGHDELAALGNTVNQMLEKIEATQRNFTTSEKRFRIVFEEAPLGIGLFDFASGKAEQTNKKFNQIIGRSREEMHCLDWQAITHPDDMPENMRFRERMISGEITGFNMRKRYFKPDGAIIWINMTISLLDSMDESDPKELSMIEDITAQVEREERIQYLSNQDVLTDVFNRRFLETEKRRLDTERQLPLSVIIVDIDGLKLINDSFGYANGDRLLVETGNILKKCCRSEDIISRMGGDEFCILLPRTTEEMARNISNRIHTTCADSAVQMGTGSLKPSMSIGYSTKTLAGENLEDIVTKAENSMRRRKLLERKSVRSNLMSSIKATMLEKSHETAEHAERLVKLSIAIGTELDLSDDKLLELELAAALHDIGKMSIDKLILVKPGELDPEEWDEIRKHPETGYRIAQATSELMPIAEYILAHHERWDGKGYPQGLKGDQIPLIARIITIVDSYDAMTENRPYRTAMSEEAAKAEIIRNAGTQFDPFITEVFVDKVLGIGRTMKDDSGVNTR